MDESLVLFIYQISSVIAAIVFNFNKILTLENDNKLLFYSLNRIFALSLHKIDGISAIQNKSLATFVLHCSQFALSLQKHLEYGNKTLSYRNTDI